ncbi:MAG TPA: hypothetical protein VHW09_26565 [Bryobacteraceae bacterium]|jgi:hypothetical protein|nr:hypothetical protein [Bryobacteraceae bacterium]
MSFKTIDDIDSFSKYKSGIKADLGRITGTPVKFHYYEKYKFHDKTGALLLVGETPPKMLEDINKVTKGMVKGRCHLESGKLQFEKTGGAEMKYATVAALVKAVGADIDVRLGAGPEDGNKLVGKELGAKFAGEDTKLGWRAEDPSKTDLDTTTTKYERTPEERAKSQAVPNAKGRLVDSAGTALHGEQGFVMDPKTGQVHTFKSGVADLPGNKKQSTHHSTPLAGAPVAGAGHLVTEAGAVKEIHDDSGHYRPSAEFTLQVVKQLEALGVSLKDETLLDGKGVEIVAEYKKKYKDIQQRIAALQIEYEKEKARLGTAFNPANASPALKGAREGIEKNLAELRALGVAPANRPAKVQLQGKSGLNDQEFQAVKGDLAKINALLEKKTGRKDVLPANTPPEWLTRIDALNLKIGEALKVTLTTQQFAQTGGNEDAIRAKAAASKLINDRSKVGLSPEEFQAAKGDLPKINAILVKKTGKKLPADTDKKLLQDLTALNLRIAEAMKERPAHEPTGAAKDAVDAQREKVKTREQDAKPKTLAERIIDLGGDAKIESLGFPKGKVAYLTAGDQLAFLQGDIDLSEAKDRAGV